MNILDTRFYAVVDRLSNLFILNIFWILSCLPIVTIVPATTAMFSVVRQWQLHQDTSVVRNYFLYFKENFKQSFIIGIIWTVISVLLYFNLFYLNQDQSGAKYIMLLPLILVSLLFTGTTAYLFAVLSHYKVTWIHAIKSSFLMAIANFPITLAILGVFAVLAAVLIYLPAFTLILFSIGAYINFSLCNRVFQKLA
ncbi:YesL family protein [Bacillus sp. USDA818B3_A]|uniref:YesL family protein n=1 Tax=Bacillus sp. USDA818B3_A TaxID=2698834 RepID=UPI00136C93DD|nr:DUF624 domain-containing protein [Bacillus sp. USDA818B3_A]